MPKKLKKTQTPANKHLKTGRLCETMAVWMLRFKGYHLIARNFTVGRGTGAGEVDVIMKKGNTLVFVEVKHRPTLTAALEAITIDNQIRVARASGVFMQKNPKYQTCFVRYDAFLYAPHRWPHHIPNAWRVL